MNYATTTPPRLTVDTSSPPLRSSSFFNVSSLPDLKPPPRPPPSPSSRNNLFDQDWSPITPNLRSRSSTAESRFSNDSKSTTASSRKSWMDVGGGGGDHSKGLPIVEKTRIIPGSRNSSEFDWPTTPPSSGSFHSASRPLSLPSFNLPPSPPSPPHSGSFSFSPRPTLPSSPSTSTILPATAGHSSNPLLDTRQAPALRMSATSPYLLGEGRHASVYLASFTPRSSNPSNPRSPPSKPERQLCAAKRLFPDRESQLSGLGEAFILSKLNSPAPPPPTPDRSNLAERGSKHILRLHGVKDERDGLESPEKTLLERSESRRSSKRYSNGGGGGFAGSPLRGEEPIESNNKYFPSNRSKGPRHSEPIPVVPTSRSPHSATSSSSRLLGSLAPPLTSSSAQRRRTQSANAPTPPPPSTLPTPIPPSEEPRIDLILEFCPYGNLLQFARNQPERMDRKRWFDWSRELVSAVAWSHERNVLHADLKPQNIMIAKDLSTRLCDFGMSLFLPPAGSPIHSFPTDPHGLGTPSYSPPEFVKPLPSSFSYPSDIFSLGITLGVMITGREPFEGVRALERMVRVGEGGWWEWEERRRLKEMEGEEVEVEEGSIYNLSLGAAEGRLSRQGSLRSLRSVRTLSRRSGSSESLKSLASLGGGARDWESIAKSLLVDNEEEEDNDETAWKALPQFTLPPLSSKSASPTHSRSTSLDGNFNLTPSTRNYPGTTTPIQTFLDGVTVVPIEVRELIRKMASPREGDRPTAKEVLDELDRLAEKYQEE